MKGAVVSAVFPLLLCGCVMFYPYGKIPHCSYDRVDGKSIQVDSQEWIVASSDLHVYVFVLTPGAYFPPLEPFWASSDVLYRINENGKKTPWVVLDKFAMDPVEDCYYRKDARICKCCFPVIFWEDEEFVYISLCGGSVETLDEKIGDYNLISFYKVAKSSRRIERKLSTKFITPDDTAYSMLLMGDSWYIVVPDRVPEKMSGYRIIKAHKQLMGELSCSYLSDEDASSGDVIELSGKNGELHITNKRYWRTRSVNINDLEFNGCTAQ